MIWNHKIYQGLTFICILSIFIGCVPTPNPVDNKEIYLKKQEEIRKIQSKNEKLDAEKRNDSSYKVIEDGFEIIHDGLDAEKTKNELLVLHNISKKDYVIGAGDGFNIFVYGEPELNIKGTRVKQDGSITLQLVGDVKIIGLSINEAMEKIATKYKKYLINPIITLVPFEFRSKSFTILGKVSAPGTYQISHNTKVIDSIAIAQGLSIGIYDNNTIELADLEHAFIRRDNKVLPVNFMELVRKGNPIHNIPLMDKDYIYIPSSLNKEVYILGEVNLASHFGFKERMTLTQLVVLAKGYKKSANIDKVAIIRGNLTNPRVFVVNLNDILEGKIKDFRIKPFDIVFIPSSVLGDWNDILKMVMPSLNAIQSAYILNQIATE